MLRAPPTAQIRGRAGRFFPGRYLPQWGALGPYGYYYPPDYYGPSYYPPQYYVPSETPASGEEAPAERPVAPYRPAAIYPPGCVTQTQKVPSESGGERTVNITRCY